MHSQGDWTEALHEHYDSKQIVDGKPVFSLSSHTLQVDGPHGAPAQVHVILENEGGERLRGEREAYIWERERSIHLRSATKERAGEVGRRGEMDWRMEKLCRYQ